MPMSFFNHPLLFAAVAVAAIGVVIFEFVNERRNHHRAGAPAGNPPRPPRDNPPRPPRDNPPRPPRDNPPRPPRDKPFDSPRDYPPKPPRDNPPGKSSSTLNLKQPPTDSKPSSTSGNSLRKRNVDQTLLKKSSSDDLKKSTETSSIRDNQNIHNIKFDKAMPDKLSNNQRSPSPSVTNSEEHNLDQASQNSLSSDLENSAKHTSINSPKKSTDASSMKDIQDKKFNENNYCKNMLDKLSNDTKNVKTEKNIFEEESVSPEDNSTPKDVEESSNQSSSDVCNSNKRVKCLKKLKNVKKTFKNHNDDRYNVCSGNSNGYETESENSSSSDENYYKMEVYNALKSDIYAMNEASKNEDCARVEDEPNMVMVDPSGESIKEEPSKSNICEACEENPINTCACPCNHSYLCVDCAVRIFRIYKKCKVCRQQVQEFVQFSS